MEKEAYSGLSLENFAAFSKFLGMLIKGFEEEILALLRKMEPRKIKMKASVCKRSQGYNVIMQRKGVEKMFWNVRGVNNEEKRKVIKSMIHSQNVYLACLWLNKGGSYLDGLGQKLRGGQVLRVECP